MNHTRQATGTVPAADQPPAGPHLRQHGEVDRLAVRRGVRQSSTAPIIEETASASEALERIERHALDGIVPGEQMEAKDAMRKNAHWLRRALTMERIARAEAERAASARDETLAIVAHDLRNPAHAIMAAASILALQAVDENSRRYLGVVERSTREMLRLISDLLDGVRIEAGTFALRREVLDVRELLEDTVEMFQTQASAKDVTLRCEVAQDISPISGDRDRLIQVLSNLLSNALRCSPEGCHVSVRASNDDRAVGISVKDSGAGIREKDLLRVFDRFWQADPASNAGGMGLGLSICRGIVEAHGGRIWAASKVDRGTTFHFTVPLADS